MQFFLNYSCCLFFPLSFQIPNLKPFQRFMRAILRSRLLATIFQCLSVLLPAPNFGLLFPFLCGIICASLLSSQILSHRHRVYLDPRLGSNNQPVWLSIRLPGFQLFSLDCLLLLPPVRLPLMLALWMSPIVLVSRMMTSWPPSVHVYRCPCRPLSLLRVMLLQLGTCFRFRSFVGRVLFLLWARCRNRLSLILGFGPTIGSRFWILFLRWLRWRSESPRYTDAVCRFRSEWRFKYNDLLKPLRRKHPVHDRLPVGHSLQWLSWCPPLLPFNAHFWDSFYGSRRPNLSLTARGDWDRRWHHWGSKVAPWFYWNNDQMESPFFRMKDDVDDEYHHSAMVGRSCHLPIDDEINLDALHTFTHICRMDHRFCFSWFLHRRFFWSEYLDFEHPVCRRTRSSRVLDGWHNVKISAIRSTHRSQIMVSSFSPDWASVTTNWLSHLPSLPVFAYYIGLALYNGHSRLSSVMARLKIAVCVLITILQAARKSSTDTLKSDTHVASNILYLMSISASVNKNGWYRWSFLIVYESMKWLPR